MSIQSLQALLRDLYSARAAPVYERLSALTERYRAQLASRHDPDLGERDAILITYGDQVSEPGVPPLTTLGNLCDRLAGLVSGVHILPFYPSSSDDGFSVIDYRAVDSRLGTWDDIKRMGRSRRLMVDAVINHISRRSAWFEAYVHDESPYRDYFITVTGDPDLSGVVRPRALPLLTRVTTNSGQRQVWTTFSEDQIDLNYTNPDVLCDIVDILLGYVARGAQLIRLDAIAYLWKEIGTSCIHLPQTHRIIQIIRLILDEVSPYVKIITETNVPHAENISYFGDGHNEAQLVYNFALPPLVMHTLRTGNADALCTWAGGLALPSDRVTFFNFLASHDGIGLNPVRGILAEEDITALVNQTQAHGGYVSYKTNSDGSQSPYELNISYFDALSDPNGPEPQETQVRRFVVAQSILLSIVGVPGIYVHSLFGSRNWRAGVALTGRHRTINRQKLARAELEQALADPSSLRSQVFTRYARLLTVRAAAAAFDPYGSQSVIPCGSAVFALLRWARQDTPPVLCLHNVSPGSAVVPRHALSSLGEHAGQIRDLISGQAVSLADGAALTLKPYDVMWLSRQNAIP